MRAGIFKISLRIAYITGYVAPKRGCTRRPSLAGASPSSETPGSIPELDVSVIFPVRSVFRRNSLAYLGNVMMS